MGWSKGTWDGLARPQDPSMEHTHGSLEGSSNRFQTGNGNFTGFIQEQNPDPNPSRPAAKLGLSTQAPLPQGSFLTTRHESSRDGRQETTLSPEGAGVMPRGLKVPRGLTHSFRESHRNHPQRTTCTVLTGGMDGSWAGIICPARGHNVGQHQVDSTVGSWSRQPGVALCSTGVAAVG